MTPDGRSWSLVLAPDGDRADIAVLRALEREGVVVTRSAVQRAFAAGLVCVGVYPARW